MSFLPLHEIVDVLTSFEKESIFSMFACIYVYIYFFFDVYIHIYLHVDLFF